jgi:hypothetical protein
VTIVVEFLAFTQRSEKKASFDSHCFDSIGKNTCGRPCADLRGYFQRSGRDGSADCALAGPRHCGDS